MPSELRDAKAASQLHVSAKLYLLNGPADLRQHLTNTQHSNMSSFVCSTMLTARPMTGTRCPDIVYCASIDWSQLSDAATWEGSPSSYAAAVVVQLWQLSVSVAFRYRYQLH